MQSASKLLKRGTRKSLTEKLKAAGLDVRELENADGGDWEPIARALVAELEAKEAANG